MVQPTTPDNINKWTNTDPTSLVQMSQSMGDSVQTALNKRERYNYVWPTVSEQNAETGMVQGSTGYQVDIKTEYIYDNGAWRPTLAYAEFASASTSVINSAFVNFGNLTIDNTYSTSTTFAVASTNSITLVDPGIYSISAYCIADAAMGATVSFALLSSDPSPLVSASQLMRGPFAADNVAGLAMPFYRTVASSQTIYFTYRQNSAGTRTISARVRVGRIG